jgi:hypothetical protein
VQIIFQFVNDIVNFHESRLDTDLCQVQTYDCTRTCSLFPNPDSLSQHLGVTIVSFVSPPSGH